MSADSLLPVIEAAKPGPRRRRGWWWKIPLGFLVLLVVVLAVVWLRLSQIATWVVNTRGPALLGTAVSVERLEVRPARGQVAVHGLRIGQPAGFGEGDLVALGRVTAHVDLKSIRGGEGIRVRALELEGLQAHVIKDADGVLNVSRLGPPAPETAGAEAVEGTGDEAGADAGAAPIQGIRLERVDVAGISVQYTDRTAGARPVEIALGSMGLALRDGRIELAEAPNVTLGEGSLTLKDIHIAQPDDFGEDALLELGRVFLDLGDQPFADNVVRLQRLEVSGLRADIIRSTNGVMNVARLGGGPPPAPATEPEDAAEVPTEVAAATDGTIAGEAAPASPPVGVYLGALEVSDVGVTYRDGVLGTDEPLQFEIRDLGLSIRDLMAFLPEPPAASSAIEFQASLAQGERPDAQLGLLGKVGPISAGIPDVNAQVKLTGLLLDTLGSLVPQGVRQTLGARGVDLAAGLALNAESIDLQGALDTDAGHSYPLLVKGPLAKPKVELGPLMFAVAGRLTGGVENLATGTAGAALDVAQGVTGGATEIGKGAADLVGNVGGGLLKSAAGALTGDLKKVGEGLQGATTDAVKDAAGSVGQAGGNVIEGAREGVDSATGATRSSAWLEALPERHQERIAAAREALEAMPFPPPGVADTEDATDPSTGLAPSGEAAAEEAPEVAPDAAPDVAPDVAP